MRMLRGSRPYRMKVVMAPSTVPWGLAASTALIISTT